MRSLLAPLALMAALTGLTFWHAGTVDRDVTRWTAQLTEIDRLAASEDWPQVRNALSVSYGDWRQCRRYLTTMTHHDMVSAAESMYCRARAFAQEEDPIEFRAELAGLMSQLRTLAESESFLPENIL